MFWPLPPNGLLKSSASDEKPLVSSDTTDYKPPSCILGNRSHIPFHRSCPTIPPPDPYCSIITALRFPHQILNPMVHCRGRKSTDTIDHGPPILLSVSADPYPFFIASAKNSPPAGDRNLPVLIIDYHTLSSSRQP